MAQTGSDKKFVIYCDEHDFLLAGMRRLVSDYPQIELLTCQTVAQVLAIIETRGLPDLLIFERAIAYDLGPEFRYSDPHEINGGFWLVQRLLEKAGDDHQISFAMVHTGMFPTNASDALMLRRLKESGRLFDAIKPYSTFKFEVALCAALGIPCQLPEVLRA